MEKKSVNKNILLNILKTTLSIVFPLITYPYATRTLGTANFGKVSFAHSIISYIALVAGLGISNYAIREGGFVRADNKKLKAFASEIFTFNLCTTVVSYVILLVLLLANSNLRQYRIVLLVQSLSIFFTTIGVDWLNVIYEDYWYITIRSIVANFLSLFFLLIFVRTPADYVLYAAINVLNSGVIAVANLIHVRRECQFSIRKPNLRKHIKPIMVLFSNNLAVSIYTNADITMIGWFFGDRLVGLYAIASKIYTILKQVIAAAYSVTITRLTEYYATRQEEKFKNLFNNVINSIIFLSLPIMIGGICTAEYIIRIIAGDEFIDAVGTLRVLLCTVLFAVTGGALAYCLNMPLRRESVNLKCTAISAIENIILNALLMPKFDILGAAIATLMSEATVAVILFLSLRKWHYLFEFGAIGRNFIKTLISCIPIVFMYHVVNRFQVDLFVKFIVVIVLSAISFFAISMVLKNDLLIELLRGFRKIGRSRDID